MRKLKVINHMSLDGVIQNSTDDDDFPFHDWTAPYRSAEAGAAVFEAHGDRFDLLEATRRDVLARIAELHDTLAVLDRKIAFYGDAHAFEKEKAG